MSSENIFVSYLVQKQGDRELRKNFNSFLQALRLNVFARNFALILFFIFSGTVELNQPRADWKITAGIKSKIFLPQAI